MTFTNFIKRPVLSTVISILIVILGVIGLLSLPIEQYPDIAPPTVVVYTQYPGADAETVKNSVITPLEESINGAEGMDYITSTAGAGSAQLSILFRQGMNADMCAVNVQNRVQQAQALLPAEVTRIVPSGHECRYVCRERAEPRTAGSGLAACRGNAHRCDGDEASDLAGAHVLYHFRWQI